MTERIKGKDRRLLAGRYSTLTGDGATHSSEELALRAANVFEAGPLDVGEGRKVLIDRVKWAELFTDFPNAPKDTNLFENMRGKTLAIWGAGNVGKASAKVATQMGMKLVFLDINPKTLEERRGEFGPDQKYLNLRAVSDALVDGILTDEKTMGLVDGCLVPGGRAPLILTRTRLKRINEERTAKGLSTLPLADASIDQGGGIEGIHPTNHSSPFLSIEGSLVYAVANVPGSRYTALYASRTLQEATINDAKLLILARARGLNPAFERDPLLATGLNTFEGQVTDKEVAGHFNRRFSSPEELIKTVGDKPGIENVVLAVPSEIKSYENRVGLLPSGVRELKEFALDEDIDLEVRVESQLGSGIGIPDSEYEESGAVVVTEGREVLLNGGKVGGKEKFYKPADIVKTVKEPMGDQPQHTPAGAFLHTYFHYTDLPDSNILDWALEKSIASFAYETRVDSAGSIPGLIPMSDVDGRANTLALVALNNPGIVELVE